MKVIRMNAETVRVELSRDEVKGLTDRLNQISGGYWSDFNGTFWAKILSAMDWIKEVNPDAT